MSGWSSPPDEPTILPNDPRMTWYRATYSGMCATCHVPLSVRVELPASALPSDTVTVVCQRHLPTAEVTCTRIDQEMIR